MEQTDAFDTSVQQLIDEERWSELANVFAGLHPADIADLIDRAHPSKHERLFSLVSNDARPLVLVELAAVAESDVLESLNHAEISRILEQMPPDDAADLLADLPGESANAVLGLMTRTEAEDVRELLKYGEETAGGIMTSDVVAMKHDQSVQEALQAIAYLESDEPFYNANVVDENGLLIGCVDIWELLREKNRLKSLGDLAHRDFVSATVDMDQEEVTHLMSKYDLNVIPVVDLHGRLVGRVTSDDAIDVIEEEASEDILRLAGSDDSELEHSSVLRSCAVRLPWLLVTLFGGFIVSFILQKYHMYISGGIGMERRTLALAAFVPTVLAMGGNAAIQSSTLVVRSIALGTAVSRNVARVLFKELAVGALMGCFCGALMGLWANYVSSPSALGTLDTTLMPHQLAAVVTTALFCAMTFATFFGASVPMILRKIDVDPAVASGPFVTIASDICALLIYFGTTILLFRILSLPQ